MQTLRAVVADDDLLVRAGIVAVIGALDDIELVGEAGSLPELLELDTKSDRKTIDRDTALSPTRRALREQIRAGITGPPALPPPPPGRSPGRPLRSVRRRRTSGSCRCSSRSPSGRPWGSSSVG